MKTIKQFGHIMFRNSVAVPILLISTAILLGIIYLQTTSNFPFEKNVEQVKADESQCLLNVHQVRLNNYPFTKPLILTDVKGKNSEYYDLQCQLKEYIDEQKVGGVIESAGIYIRKLNGSNPIDINADETFKPGSIAKISILITYLKMAEKNPKLLETTYSLNPGEYVPIQQSFPSQEIIVGKKYAVKVLLEYMIVKSANSATALLTEYIDQKVFENLFNDLELPEVSLTNSNYQMSASGVSKFMRVLYNSSYLTPESSEAALELLSRTEFNNGISNKLPKNLKIAHKFGEQGDAQSKQLHETAIIYLDNIAYTITVMTKGKDMKNLSNFISEVSKMVYNRFNVNI